QTCLQEQPKRITRVERERLFERLLGFFSVAQRELDLGELPPCLGVVAVRLDNLVHDAQPGFLLPLFELGVGALDVAVDVLAAPLELLATTAGTEGVLIDIHHWLLCAGEFPYLDTPSRIAG